MTLSKTDPNAEVGCARTVKIDADFLVRVYFNRDNELEPFCLDFGKDTPTIVANAIEIHGDWLFQFDAESDPKAWFSPSLDSVIVEVEVYLSQSKVVATTFMGEK